MTDEVKTAIENAGTAAEAAAATTAKSLWAKLQDEVKVHHVVVTAVLVGFLLGCIVMYFLPFKH
jgi:hypothetical protein